MKRILRSLCLILLAAAAFSSCDPGPAGIFATLENEQPHNKGTTILNANTTAFVLRYTVGAVDYYYAGIGARILRRPAAGGSWADVSDSVAPSGSIITAGVTDGTNLYVSYAPANAAVRMFDGTVWADYNTGLPADQPVQSLLMADDGRLFAATQSSSGTTTSDYVTYYSIWYDNAGTFVESFDGEGVPVTTGVPSSIARVGTTYWISAYTTVITGTYDNLAVDAAVPTDYINSAEPVFNVFYDGTRVIASGTGYLFNLSDSYTRSAVFGSADRHLSSLAMVPANGAAAEAVIVGVKPWSPDDYRGYYEYDASIAAFSSITPNGDYSLIADNSDYVTSLDDKAIEGVYYDSTGQRLFARTVRGLWSKAWDGSSWSIWDRE